jgi:hypothetical protein
LHTPVVVTLTSQAHVSWMGGKGDEWQRERERKSCHWAHCVAKGGAEMGRHRADVATE